MNRPMHKSTLKCSPRLITCLSLGLLILISFSVPFLCSGLDSTTSDGLKVQHILKTIESHQSQPGKTATQSATITQKELNNYFAYRLAQEKNPLIKMIDVILDEGNRVRGKVHVDLEGVQLLNLFGTNLNFDFDGLLQTREGTGKLDLTSLLLNGEAVSPRSLDPLLMILASFYGEEPGSIDDWYELPHGIRHIKLSKARAILFY